MYAMMKKLGIPLTEHQQAIQDRLEKLYPPVVEATEEEDEN